MKTESKIGIIALIVIIILLLIITTLNTHGQSSPVGLKFSTVLDLKKYSNYKSQDGKLVFYGSIYDGIIYKHEVYDIVDRYVQCFEKDFPDWKIDAFLEPTHYKYPSSRTWIPLEKENHSAVMQFEWSTSNPNDTYIKCLYYE